MLASGNAYKRHSFWIWYTLTKIQVSSCKSYGNCIFVSLCLCVFVLVKCIVVLFYKNTKTQRSPKWKTVKALPEGQDRVVVIHFCLYLVFTRINHTPQTCITAPIEMLFVEEVIFNRISQKKGITTLAR